MDLAYPCMARHSKAEHIAFEFQVGRHVLHGLLLPWRTAGFVPEFGLDIVSIFELNSNIFPFQCVG